MKLTPRVLTVIKNFSIINPGLKFGLFDPDVLYTKSPSGNLFARAKIDVSFDQPFCIHDLSKFLTVLSLFKEPELTMDEKWVTIEGERQSIRWTYASEESIVLPKGKAVKMPSADIEFTLTPDMLSSVLKASSALGVSSLAVCGNGKKMTLEAFDESSSTTNVYRLEIGDTSKNFQVVFKTEYFKFLPGTYNVTICRTTGGMFRGDDVDYWLTFLPAHSHFGD